MPRRKHALATLGGQWLKQRRRPSPYMQLLSSLQMDCPMTRFGSLVFAALLSFAPMAGGILSATAAHAAPRRAILPTGIVLAADDGVMVHDAWARASAGAAPNGAAYVALSGGAKPDSLTGISTPVAEAADVHETIDDHGVMKMRSVPAVPIPAGQQVIFKPGGYHIMLMGLKQPLVAGQTFKLTLTFAHAAPVTIDVPVRGRGDGSGGTPGMGGHMH